MVGSNYAVELNERLIYSTTSTPVQLEIILPVVLVITLILLLCPLIILLSVYINHRRKSMSLAMHEQILELVAQG